MNPPPAWLIASTCIVRFQHNTENRTSNGQTRAGARKVHVRAGWRNRAYTRLHCRILRRPALLRYKTTANAANFDMPKMLQDSIFGMPENGQKKQRSKGVFAHLTLFPVPGKCK